MKTKHPEPSTPTHILRREDIIAMIADGTIKDQHFLIRLLAKEIQSEN